MLHITNGDSAANLIEACNISGDTLAWRDPMHHGPFPQGLTLDALRPLRAKHLAGHGLSVHVVEQDFQHRDEKLRRAHTHEEVTLWFEHDLLDQLQLLQLLDWFAEQEPLPDLQIICINTFPGIVPFRGIGQLTPAQTASIYPLRTAVTSEMMTLAKLGWAAFTSPDPTDLMQFLSGDLHALPFLHAALSRHLEEFPSTVTGLTRSESHLLTLLKNGPSDPNTLFVQNMELETVFFMGDWPTFAILDRLGALGLLETQGQPLRYHAASEDERAAYRKQILTLSKTGAKALDGHIDSRALHEHGRWLGGVHFQTDKPHWTWDTDTKTLKLRAS